MTFGERDGERDAVRVGDQVVLGAGLAAVDRAGAGWSPCEGAQVGGVDQGRGQIQQAGHAQLGEQPFVRLLPASCHEVNRRQQVAPEAPNKAVDSRFLPIPVRTT